MNPEQLLKAIQQDHETQKEIESRYFQSCKAMSLIAPILNEQISTESKIAKMDLIANNHGFSDVKEMHQFRMLFQKNPALQ
jgi:hypothetical protein